MSAGRTMIAWRNVNVSRGVWGVVLVGAVACGAWVSHADETSTPIGLRGVLPAGVPVDLQATISTLPENWKAWGESLGADLSALYEKEDADLAGQKKAIADLKGRLKTVRASLADPRYKSITTQLVALGGGLKRRLEVAEAALATLELGPEVKQARIDAARKNLDQSAASLNKYLGSIKGGAGWVSYLRVGEIRSQLSDSAKSAVTLASVQSRLNGKVELADAKVRDFMQKPQIVAYEDAVNGYLSAVNAAAPGSNNPELRKALGELLTAIENYEIDHSVATAGAVRKTFEAVRPVAPDGGERISSALRTNYFNYNLKVVASEGFVNRLVSEHRQESGGVTDFILGANVSGNQTTATDVTVNLVPSASVAQFDIVASGAISSSTVGVTDQANIYTQGNHYFRAEKRILFNGDKFWTQAARIGVNANNTTLDADTQYSGIPLFGGFADRIAMGKAEEMRPQSEAIAASRVQDQVLPKFNSEVDKEFGVGGKANGEFAQRLAALQELHLYPDAKVWSTTDSELRVASRLMGASELGGSEPNSALLLGRGLTLLVHESLMNNVADRLEIKGQTLSDDQLKAKLETQLTKLLGREVKFKGETEGDAETKAQLLVFDPADPIRFRVADGALVVTLKVGVKQEGKEDIPTQVVSVPLSFSVNNKNVVIDRGSVSVSAAEKAASAAEQLARAGVIRKKIEAAFPRREIDRVSYIERDKKKTMVAVTRIKALDGWLSVTFE